MVSSLCVSALDGKRISSDVEVDAVVEFGRVGRRQALGINSRRPSKVLHSHCPHLSSTLLEVSKSVNSSTTFFKHV